ncbi:MAG: di-heme oxidoredictase family protein [Gammaproteobacteria bacterium]
MPDLSRLTLSLLTALILTGAARAAEIGSERAVHRHLQNGDEFEMPLEQLIDFGEALFRAPWTIQDGGGRPLSKGTGADLVDPASPLVFPRNFNRVSGPDSNACAGCHAQPRIGGGGDIVTNVFVLGQRFDFASFDLLDPVPTRGSADEAGRATTLQSIANERATLGMFGSGYIEMLAREMTARLQHIRDSMPPGSERRLRAQGVDFGRLSRDAAGNWDTSQVEGLPAPSLHSSGPESPPDLIIRPFHQAGAVVSLRQFTNNAFNHHHGMQSAERFGEGVDPDGDGFVDELTRADITAVTIFQATLPVPGRVIPRDPEIEAAIALGEQRFSEIGCVDCHLPNLRLSAHGDEYSEPNPYNPQGNLQPGEAPELVVNLSSRHLPQPRLRGNRRGVVTVPAYTDLKLHHMCDGPKDADSNDSNEEPLDMQQAAGTAAFFAGNCRFLTRKLWGVASEPPYFHHGKFTTLREAVLAHAGEAGMSRHGFGALTPHERDAVIEFLKSLQVLPPGTRSLVVDEHGRPRPGYARR